jgi:hypothetical protein
MSYWMDKHRKLRIIRGNILKNDEKELYDLTRRIKLSVEDYMKSNEKYKLSTDEMLMYLIKTVDDLKSTTYKTT